MSTLSSPTPCVRPSTTSQKTSLDFFENGKIDLVVTGPNEGTNLGAFVYSLSGTCGAAYASAMFGVPAIAFSAVNSTHRPYYDITDSPYDPATLAGELVANLVNSLADGWDRKSTILPKSIGLNVNFPNLNKTCSEPPYVLTRECLVFGFPLPPVLLLDLFGCMRS